MQFKLVKYQNEVIDFLNEKTLYEIDCGILDLHNIENTELKCVLHYLEDMLKLELRANYLMNDTGIFRVERKSGIWYYREMTHEIEAGSLNDLKELVLAENRIWYVFDEFLAENKGGK